MATGFNETRELFDSARRVHPDLMEPYVILLADCASEVEQQSVMWRGMRETIKRRFPMGQQHEETP